MAQMLTMDKINDIITNVCAKVALYSTCVMTKYKETKSYDRS